MRLISLKKILLLIFTIFLFSSSVQAKTLKAEALDNFSPAYHKEVFRVKVIETQEIKKGLFIDDGTIICGQIITIKGPQRGKRDGYIEFIPIKVTYGNMNIETPEFIARVTGYEPIDPQRLIINISKKAVGLIFHGATQGISFIEGAAKAKEGQRLKSGLFKIYKDSPLSYIEVGDELNVKTGDILTLKLKKNR